MMKDPIELFRTAMFSAGLEAPDAICGDGKVHRFSPSGKRKDGAGWYVLHLDKIPAGCFGNWRDGTQEKWCAKGGAEMTVAERAAIRSHIVKLQEQREADDESHRDVAARKALAIWSGSPPAESHAYLQKKGVGAHGVRVANWPKWDKEVGAIRLIDDVLLIPMRDVHQRLWSLQGIGANGEKFFLPGGRVRGCYHSIGRPSGRVVIGEGYATCATIHESTGDGVAVAFNAGNLEAVARNLRAKFPELPFVIAADDDWATRDQRTGALSNPGMTAARRAAAAVGGKVAVPDFTGLPRNAKDTDFNDLLRLAQSAEASK